AALDHLDARPFRALPDHELEMAPHAQEVLVKDLRVPDPTRRLGATPHLIAGILVPSADFADLAVLYGGLHERLGLDVDRLRAHRVVEGELVVAAELRIALAPDVGGAVRLRSPDALRLVAVERVGRLLRRVEDAPHDDRLIRIPLEEGHEDLVTHAR